MSRLAAAAFVLVACQSGSSAPSAAKGVVSAAPAPAVAAAPAMPASGDYAADVERLCNSEKYSGADQQAPGARQMLIAAWLGPNLKTSQIHEFLARFQTTPDGAKKKLLLTEAASVGLAGCALADEWK